MGEGGMVEGAGTDLYGAAFEPKTQTQVSEAVADRFDLSEEARSFTIGLLLYLNLQTQAG